MNKLIINGNLVSDMEVSVGDNFTVGNFTIANNEGYGDKQRTTFLRCSVFGENRVSSLERYLVKGAKVLLTGELNITSKERKKGQYDNYTSLVVDTLEIQKFVEEEDQQVNRGKKTNRKK